MWGVDSLWLSLSVIQVKQRNDEGVIRTIDLAWGDSGDIGISHIKAYAVVGKGVTANHVATHIVSPFDHLGADVDEECL